MRAYVLGHVRRDGESTTCQFTTLEARESRAFTPLSVNRGACGKHIRLAHSLTSRAFFFLNNNFKYDT